MKIVLLSDTHNTHHELSIPDGDMLIHSGDALGRGTYSETLRFNEWLGSLPHKHKIYVPGNHDQMFEDNPEVGRDIMSHATVLMDEAVEIEGLKIYGSPWTPQFFNWAFMKPDSELANYWAKIPEGLDILITHGPPHGLLDQNNRGYHCGSQTLYQAVVQKKPRLHVFGHIHESSGILKTDDTTFVNAAVLDGWYNYGNDPKVIELERK